MGVVSHGHHGLVGTGMVVVGREHVGGVGHTIGDDMM